MKDFLLELADIMEKHGVSEIGAATAWEANPDWIRIEGGDGEELHLQCPFTPEEARAEGMELYRKSEAEGAASE